MFLSFLFSFSLCDKYAILFAGSNGWGNYRHQADVFYMYKILKNHGFDDDHISLWAYNDIVNNAQNPYKGQVFHTLDNENVYPGENVIDFKGDYLKAVNFIHYLKTLDTTEEDDIFIYYNDHGSPNYLSCPVGVPMSSYQIASTFEVMQRLKKYRRIFFVVESCYSGTVGDALRSDNISIITASTNSQSSYSYIYHRYADNFMSNEFSAFIMSEMESNPNHTIQTLYDAARKKVTTSQPQIYGQNLDLPISNFIGVPKDTKAKPKRLSLNFENRFVQSATTKEARDEQKKNKEKMKELTRKLTLTMKKIVRKVAGRRWSYYMKKDEVRNLQQCHEPVADTFFELFGEFNPNDGGLLMPLKALCADYDKDVIIAAINSTLSK